MVKSSIEKDASRGTTLRVIRALGGGARGRHYLDVLRRSISRWMGGSSRSAPDYLHPVVERLFRQTRLPVQRLYGVIDPTGRLERLREFSVPRTRAFAGRLGVPTEFDGPVTSWFSDVRNHPGGSTFFPLPDKFSRSIPEMRDRFSIRYRQAIPNAERMRNIGYRRVRDNPVERNMISEWLSSFDPKLLRAGASPHAANVEMLPGETPAQAIQRDLMTRINAGTVLSGRRGANMIRHARLGLNSNGEPRPGDLYRPDALDTDIKPYISRVFNSAASPMGVQGVASRNGNTLTYYPDVMLHEYGHMIDDYPGVSVPGAGRRFERMRSQAYGDLARGSRSPAPPRSAISGRTARGWRNNYGNPSGPLPAASAWARDPIQLFRQLNPTVYGEIAADVNAFGTNSRVWPLFNRRALGSYLRSSLSDPRILARMPGASKPERVSALRDYIRMAHRFVNAPEVPYATSLGGAPRWDFAQLNGG